MTFQQQRPARLAARVGVVAALAVILSGCGLAEPAGGDATDAGGSAWQEREFAALYEQEIEWYECGPDEGLDGETADALSDVGFDLEQIGCALITAPLDWNDTADHDTITLSIVHIPSTGDEPLGTLMGNPGGPGATGVDFMLGMGLSPGFEDVAAHYDLLGFDPRGIGASTPIDCDGAGSENPVVQLGVCLAEEPLAHTMGTS